VLFEIQSIFQFVQVKVAQPVNQNLPIAAFPLIGDFVMRK
jgi:hypothetical protein